MCDVNKFVSFDYFKLSNYGFIMTKKIKINHNNEHTNENMLDNSDETSYKKLY